MDHFVGSFIDGDTVAPSVCAQYLKQGIASVSFPYHFNHLISLLVSRQILAPAARVCHVSDIVESLCHRAYAPAQVGK